MAGEKKKKKKGSVLHVMGDQSTLYQWIFWMSKVYLISKGDEVRLWRRNLPSVTIYSGAT